MLECARGGFCSSHVCAQGAKANPLSAVLPALTRQPTFELRPLCNVLRVNTDSTGKKATGVTYIDARGNEVRINGRLPRRVPATARARLAAGNG